MSDATQAQQYADASTSASNRIARKLLASVVRHLIGMIAGWLVLHGYFASADAANMTQLLTGAAVGTIIIAWSWWQKFGERKMLTDMSNVVHVLSQHIIAKYQVEQTQPIVTSQNNPAPNASPPAVPTQKA